MPFKGITNAYPLSGIFAIQAVHSDDRSTRIRFQASIDSNTKMCQSLSSGNKLFRLVKR